jgi:hypothetical protein
MASKKEREYTPQQMAFRRALIGEAKGDIQAALQIAGYSENTRPADIIRTLRAEIIEDAMDMLALKATRAVHNLSEVMENPTSGGASNVIKVANSILDRVGVQNKDSLALNVPAGGLVIMPAKRRKDDVDDTESLEED